MSKNETTIPPKVKELFRIYRDGIAFPAFHFGVQVKKTKLRGVGIWQPDNSSICIGVFYTLRFYIFECA